MVAPQVAGSMGLPPQVRGELQDHIAAFADSGLTPAGAGRTAPRQRCAVCRGAYPRRCGENWVVPVGIVALWGLPPQVRGELAVQPDGRQRPGLTPAGAGRTVRGHGVSGGCPAYPRRCGENCHSRSRSAAGPGLPPQVRGEPGRGVRRARVDGLTPAGAGRTTWSAVCTTGRGAYPRRCGENRKRLEMRRDQLGLPPQVRGELGGLHSRVNNCRLTPAGAGRTSQRQHTRGPMSAYPRRCGENGGRRLTGLAGEGLPPQVRGEPETGRC